ncbi:MAG: GatB/YqeY domain-containing protein [Salinisphaera sp.]|nr:GatB/YqeY domain-containing protein [Salinisphaera sp.]MDN5937548.1 GatB/YqeY domain-containing protein [Salinisphaera sp.]
MSMTLKEQIGEDMKSAMRARERERLSVVRMLLAAIKQKEIDERVSLDDAGVLAVVEKMVKQRRDAESQYRDAGRAELAAAEAAEIAVLGAYLPEPLDDVALQGLIEDAITATGATTMRDMGQVMGVLKPQVQGRADMAAVSGAVKKRLG